MFKNQKGFTLIEMNIGDYPYSIERHLLNKLIKIANTDTKLKHAKYNSIKRKIERLNSQM